MHISIKRLLRVLTVCASWCSGLLCKRKPIFMIYSKKEKGDRSFFSLKEKRFLSPFSLKVQSEADCCRRIRTRIGYPRAEACIKQYTFHHPVSCAQKD